MMMILKAKNPHFLLQSTKPPNDKIHSNKHKRKSIPSVTECQCLLCNSDVGKLVHEFDPKVPVEKAVVPPSSWYIDPSFFPKRTGACLLQELAGRRMHWTHKGPRWLFHRQIGWCRVFGFFFFFFLGLCSYIWVCVLVVLVQDTFRYQFVWFLVFNSGFNFFFLI